MKYSMPMVIEYARVFESNYDEGDPNGNDAARSVAKKGGQTIVNAYFTDQEQIDTLLSDGLNPAPLGHQRILDGNEEFGIGKYMKIKRQVSDNIHTFNNKSGDVTLNFGGFPKIVDIRDMDNKRLWDTEEDGFLGNGTKAQVMFETYSQGSGVRIVAIGVTEHVPYEEHEKKYDESLFEVD